MIFSDIDLARRIERTEASANANFVEARARLFPESGAEWVEVAGAYAMFDGSAESPLTQTFGLGVFEEITGAELEKLEAFFKRHDAPVFHEVSPLSGVSLAALLSERGYQPIEFSNVLYRPVEVENNLELSINPKIQTRIIEKGEENLWARLAADGWSTEAPGLSEFMLDLGNVIANSAGYLPFLAEIEGQPIAASVLFIRDDVALLAGASTIPEARRQGAQLALLHGRLRYAAEKGCAIATMVAMPGSQSQKNAEKHGFRIAYTRTKWHLKI
jgi:GNAT superfamily N-acetyltransferase